MTTTAVLPIKRLDNAKQRLGGLLDPDERRGLFRAMVEDVLTAAEACVLIDDILVVTNDDEVADLVMAYGARVLPEPETPGLIAAVTLAAAELVASGVDNMVFLPGDVPMVSPDELEVVLEGFGAGDGPAFTIAPASDLGGSNCVACHPPNCIEFGFGEDSFRRHLGRARERGIEPEVVKLPGVGLDVDTPDDLEALAQALMAAGDEGNTFRFLRDSGVMDKLVTVVT